MLENTCLDLKLPAQITEEKKSLLSAYFLLDLLEENQIISSTQPSFPADEATIDFQVKLEKKFCYKQKRLFYQNYNIWRGQLFSSISTNILAFLA